MKNLPPTGFLRLSQIIGDKRKPHLIPIIPVSRSRWYDGVKKGSFPPSIRIGSIVVWRVEDIRYLLDHPEAVNDRYWANEHSNAAV
jgi:predicted DNA-binding transcriptional regulator AlpA